MIPYEVWWQVFNAKHGSISKDLGQVISRAFIVAAKTNF